MGILDVPGYSRAAADLRFGAPRPVANRTAMPGVTTAQGGISNGTDTAGNYRFQHDTRCGAHALRLVYSNVLNIAGSESSGQNPITVRASIESGGIFYPVTFNGQRSVVIEPGATVQSDPVGFSIGPVSATNFFTRTFVSVASAGMTWPLSLLSQGSEGGSHGTSETDKTLSGTIAASSDRLFGPSAILGIPEESKPFVGLVGDSILAGISHFSNRSFLVQALDLLNVPYINLGMSSEPPSRWLLNQFRYRRAPLLGNVTHIICEQGVNALPQAQSSVLSDMQGLWAYLSALGLPLFQTTITPKTTSTDSFASAIGQTVTSDESKRLALNTLIRTAPSPLTGILEIADIAETARDSGKWKFDGTANKWTADGIHPGSYGHTQMGAAAAPLIAAALGI